MIKASTSLLIKQLCEDCNLKPKTLYHFGKLGLLTGEEFVEAFLNTVQENNLVISKERLRTLKKTRFKEGKLYCSGLTKEERWGCTWCINLIDELLEEKKA